MANDIADRIEFLSKDIGITILKLKVGWDRKAITDIKAGLIDPPYGLLRKLCNELELRPEWLFLGEGQPYQKRDLKKQGFELSDIEQSLIKHYRAANKARKSLVLACVSPVVPERVVTEIEARILSAAFE